MSWSWAETTHARRTTVNNISVRSSPSACLAKSFQANCCMLVSRRSRNYSCIFIQFYSAIFHRYTAHRAVLVLTGGAWHQHSFGYFLSSVTGRGLLSPCFFFLNESLWKPWIREKHQKGNQAMDKNLRCLCKLIVVRLFLKTGFIHLGSDKKHWFFL